MHIHNFCGLFLFTIKEKEFLLKLCKACFCISISFWMSFIICFLWFYCKCQYFAAFHRNVIKLNNTYHCHTDTNFKACLYCSGIALSIIEWFSCFIDWDSFTTSLRFLKGTQKVMSSAEITALLELRCALMSYVAQWIVLLLWCSVHMW